LTPVRSKTRIAEFVRKGEFVEDKEGNILGDNFLFDFEAEQREMDKILRLNGTVEFNDERRARLEELQQINESARG